ncbi:hypothetical protein CHS0354_025535 [Potamilus streckersoni]|uniref:Coiled-coil domain-containing protein 137 n=1 Tax=Potamilus streckersoni TaxID=2493646 RepID=A0AAE0SL01_9BIVA|nr:hypothetical protein CHS0354_025535 [Potamilus streckersoni]
MGKLGIGKPQKSKKHKKLKSVNPPAGRERSGIKPKLNNLRPTNEDEQEIPSKVKFIMDFKGNPNLIKKIRKRKKKKAAVQDKGAIELVRGISRPFKPIPDFTRLFGETEKAYFSRVERDTERVLIKSKLEDKFKVNFDDSVKGQLKVIRQKSRKKKEKLKERDVKKKMKKKLQKIDRMVDFSAFKDDVRFGEVALQPPTINAKPRKAVIDFSEPKPGKKSLLLKEMFKTIPEEKVEKSKEKNLQSNARSLADRPIGQTVKRKYLSIGEQRIADQERQSAIERYRKLKGKKMIIS